MKDAYTKLMVQQHTTTDGDAAFYEKLEQAQPKKRANPILRAAVVAACLCLLIPVTVYAVQNIFGLAKATQMDRPLSDNQPGIGLDIHYENIENFSVKDFPKHLQKLEEGELLLHSSLEEAAQHLGLALIDNPILTAEGTNQVAAFKERGKHHQTFCGVYDGQLIFTQVQSVYKRNDVQFKVSAMATVEHPTLDEAEYHSINITYYDHHSRKIQTEQYTTQAGIPVLIVTVRDGAIYNYDADYGALSDCFACFAVDNISYQIELTGWHFDSEDRDTFATPEEKVKATLLEVLDGFVIE